MSVPCHRSPISSFAVVYPTRFLETEDLANNFLFNSDRILPLPIYVSVLVLFTWMRLLTFLALRTELVGGPSLSSFCASISLLLRIVSSSVALASLVILARPSRAHSFDTLFSCPRTALTFPFSIVERCRVDGLSSGAGPASCSKLSSRGAKTSPGVLLASDHPDRPTRHCLLQDLIVYRSVSRESSSCAVQRVRPTKLADGPIQRSQVT